MSAPSTDQPLTRNQLLVFDALAGAGGPLSAYAILDLLRDDGFRAPLQVYRALDKLVELGRVHRLECLNAFVACSHPGCESHETVAFTICEECGRVDEIASDGLARRLRSLGNTSQFKLRKSTVELRGICSDCSSH